jgi:GNAT superfamily N-acetyltransferase
MIRISDLLLYHLNKVIAAMKGFSLLLVILVLSIYHLDAFLPSSRPTHHNHRHHESKTGQVVNIRELYSSGPTEENNKKSENKNNKNLLTHADIVWKLRPPPETSRWTRISLRLASNFVRLEHKLRGEDPPLLLCPRGGQAVLEAFIRTSTSKYGRLQKIARFGFTTERGPSALPIQESVADIYDNDSRILVGVAAIIYMFVEPEYRKRNVGTMALEVISLIQAVQYCDFTILVVDDDGSGKLVEWYEKNGYSRAPKLQDMLGSPNAVNGVTMIAPTRQVLPPKCQIQWW